MQNDKEKSLEQAVTTERLQNCTLEIKNSQGDKVWITNKQHLYQLYLANEAISKEIRFIVSQFEVLLRNKIDKAVSLSRGANWLLDLIEINFWKSDEIQNIKEAEKRLTKSNKEINHWRVLAKMNLGFWLRLFNNPYFEYLIRDNLKIIFPSNKVKLVKISYGISDFRENFGLIQVLRNKVSHQEFILSPKYRVRHTYDQIILIMKMMDESYYDHFKHMDNFAVAYNALAETIKKIKEEMEVAENINDKS